MRACIVGGGLAGSLLAWRLVRARTDDWRLDLVAGRRSGAGGGQAGNGTAAATDATAASGGAVRAYETDPQQRGLAIASMVELLGSATLQRWADFRRVRSVYLRRSRDGLDGEVADIELMLPGSARVVTAGDLAGDGWDGLHPGGCAVVEHHAGYTSPARLREAVLADGPLRRRVSVLAGEVEAITPLDSGAISCRVDGQCREYDLVVVAAGAWTSALLVRAGLPAAGYRTKSIQYRVYQVGDWCPPQFVDEVAGLFGRPTADGGLLLGLPTDEWDVDPDRPQLTPALHDAAARLATARFPRLQLGPVLSQVASADSYCDQPVLTLRPLIDTDHQLFTFAGGAGGSVKTVLAATHRAAVQLVERGQSTQTSSVGRRKGQP